MTLTALEMFLCWPNDQSLPQDHGTPAVPLIDRFSDRSMGCKESKKQCIEQAATNTGRKMSRDLFASWTQSALSDESKECSEGKSEQTRIDVTIL